MRLKGLQVNRLSERGDTLVEVLVCIAIISLILGGAYVTTNRSLQSTRDAQERGDALKLVESQIEQLKNIDSAVVFGTPLSNYCIAGGTVADTTSAQCLVDASGTPTATQPAYRLSITRSANTFTVRNTWTNLRDSQNNVEMKYRVYER